MTTKENDYLDKIIQGDSLELIKDVPNDYVHLILTSPHYFGARVYGNETLGREQDPRDYIRNLLKFTLEFKRVLHKEGSFYLNIGDIYFGSKGFSRNKGRYARKTDKHYKEHKIIKPNGHYLQHKQLLMLPERLAIGMQEQGWILRNKIIWEKPNPVPSYSPDRRYPVYEHIFHFVKSRKYYFDLGIAKELQHHRDIIRNKIEPFKKHQATFPLSLIQPFILTTTRKKDIVFDPFMGSGTTAIASIELDRHYLGFEINPEYYQYSLQQIESTKKKLVEKESLTQNYVHQFSSFA